MKIREGYYILNSPENPVTEAEVNALIKYLMEDIQSESPRMRWDFHPTRSNLCVFVGGDAGSTKYRYIFEKAPIKGGYQIIFNHYKGGKSIYTVVDLCMGPRSELHELYGYVSRAVHGTAWKRGSLTASRTIIIN